MQILAGRVAQGFNMRKRRNGAFWEDRYHATAVMSGKHLRRCTTAGKILVSKESFIGK